MKISGNLHQGVLHLRTNFHAQRFTSSSVAVDWNMPSRVVLKRQTPGPALIASEKKTEFKLFHGFEQAYCRKCIIKSSYARRNSLKTNSSLPLKKSSEMSDVKTQLEWASFNRLPHLIRWSAGHENWCADEIHLDGDPLKFSCAGCNPVRIYW